MNFAPFSGHIPAATALPTIQQFAAKFGYENNGVANSAGVVQETRYQGTGNVQFAVAPAPGGLAEGVKFRQAESVVVVSGAPPSSVTLTGIAPIHTVNTGVKYQTISASTSTVNLGNISYGGQPYVQESHVVKEREKREREEYHDLMLQQAVAQATPLAGGQQLVVLLHEPKEAALGRHVKQEARLDRMHNHNDYIIVSSAMDGSEGAWQLGGVPEYLSALPLPLHHLLKYSPPADKRDEPSPAPAPAPAPAVLALAGSGLPPMQVLASATSQTEQQIQTSNSVVIQTSTIVQPARAESASPSPAPTTAGVREGAGAEVSGKKKKKKKYVKEKKERPKPGEIRLTTALDGSTLYCCPECHMVYPERDLLEQHLLGHTMERRFICNICNAALKRKDHLTRHKQSHNSERPHICSVCLKAFKRKEQLTLHFVIHSGEKRHICNECGKGFYRKDHLRKHTRSHIARRVKAELSAGAAGADRASPPLRAPPAPAPPC